MRRGWQVGYGFIPFDLSFKQNYTVFDEHNNLKTGTVILFNHFDAYL